MRDRKKNEYLARALKKESLTGFLLWRQYWRQYWGKFFGGRFSLKNGTICPLSSHDSSYFKNM
jgi:hypothetical protein